MSKLKNDKDARRELLRKKLELEPLLTDDEIAEIENEYIVDYRIPAGSAWNFAKDIETKLKQKNTKGQE